jgi:hypothetical protein
MHELEVTNRGREMRVAASDEAKAKGLIGSALAEWGIPLPPTVRESSQSTFVDRLAETGSYLHAEGDVSIIVNRSP